MITFIILLVITGLIVGALGRLAIPGRDPMSIGQTILEQEKLSRRQANRHKP